MMRHAYLIALALLSSSAFAGEILLGDREGMRLTSDPSTVRFVGAEVSADVLIYANAARTPFRITVDCSSDDGGMLALNPITGSGSRSSFYWSRGGRTLTDKLGEMFCDGSKQRNKKGS